MPIRPENRNRYPKNWASEIRPAILERAGNCCEGSPDFPDCHVPNGWFRNTVTGELTDDSDVAIDWDVYEGQRVSKIVLTIGHLDHTPENCDPDNLRAWCQRCHLHYDREHHAETRAATRRAQSPQLELIG